MGRKRKQAQMLKKLLLMVGERGPVPLKPDTICQIVEEMATHSGASKAAAMTLLLTHASEVYAEAAMRLNLEARITPTGLLDGFKSTATTDTRAPVGFHTEARSK